ncbi:hypothetical protein Tco_0614966 [Tanacetum coccineum]
MLTYEKLKVTFLQILNIPGVRKYASAFVPDLVCSLSKCLYYFVWSFPFWEQFSVFLRVGSFVTSVYKVSWLEGCFAALSRFSSSMSKLSIKASSFRTWSTSAHLNEGIPISTGITVRSQVEGRRGVAFAVLIMVQRVLRSLYQSVSLRVLDGCKILLDVELVAPVLEGVVSELLSVIRYDLLCNGSFTFWEKFSRFLSLLGSFGYYLFTEMISWLEMVSGEKGVVSPLLVYDSMFALSTNPFSLRGCLTDSTNFLDVELCRTSP